MFGTMGFSELIIILVIVLIIFGAGKLPQIGEGVGKALKGFKKEVHDVPTPETAAASAEPSAPPVPPAQGEPGATSPAAVVAAQPTQSRPAPYIPGPEMTPGTTAAAMANLGPQGPQATQPARARVAAPTPGQTPSENPHQPPTMEDRMASPAPAMRAQYPPLPAGAQPKPIAKRPSAVVNKEAVARVQATQAAMKAKSANASTGMSPQDMQNVGEGLGDALRTFRQAVADVRNSVDPEMRTIQAEIDAAQKELEQSIEAAKQPSASHENSSDKSTS
ncbi:MAG: twin-arginine translocase TatA/TatE family subunit [Nitrospiraceae bacterium]